MVLSSRGKLLPCLIHVVLRPASPRSSVPPLICGAAVATLFR